ncbi:hypothetical protein Ct9H90mP29_01700 [bacterium]|nr:MAG: hypothetical protein Ct9H90mP29_01700 [bacterium]
MIATPTSVASVKGTELAIDSDPSTGDSFTLIEGLIEVTNNLLAKQPKSNKVRQLSQPLKVL